MSEPSPELVEIAHACFDFARQGDTTRLGAYVDQGVPRALVAAGADLAAGTPSARATAQMFGREDLLRPGRS